MPAMLLIEAETDFLIFISFLFSVKQAFALRNLQNIDVTFYVFTEQSYTNAKVS